MKKISTLLAVLGVCMFSAAASARGMHFLTAYDLQQICMQQDGVDNSLDGAQCKGYIEAVADFAYSSEDCQIPLNTRDIMIPLADYFNETPDTELQQMLAAQAVYFVITTQTKAAACFGGAML